MDTFYILIRSFFSKGGSWLTNGKEELVLGFHFLFEFFSNPGPDVCLQKPRQPERERDIERPSICIKRPFYPSMHQRSWHHTRHLLDILNLNQLYVTLITRHLHDKGRNTTNRTQSVFGTSMWKGAEPK